MCERCEDRERMEQTLHQLEIEKLRTDYIVRKKMELLEKLEKAEKLVLKGKFNEAAQLLDEISLDCRIHSE